MADNDEFLPDEPREERPLTQTERRAETQKALFTSSVKVFQLSEEDYDAHMAAIQERIQRPTTLKDICTSVGLMPPFMLLEDGKLTVEREWLVEQLLTLIEVGLTAAQFLALVDEQDPKWRLLLDQGMTPTEFQLLWEQQNVGNDAE